MALTIPTTIKNRIYSCFGYPVIPLSDLSNGRFDEEYLLDTFVYPAMQEYFRYFPVEVEESFTAPSTFEKAFPDIYTFGIVTGRQTMIPTAGTSPTANPIINETFIKTSDRYGYGSGRFGTKYDYELRNATIYDTSLVKALESSYKGVKIRVDRNNRKVLGYNNTNGRIDLVWAKYSEDWSKIAYTWEDSIIKLAQANILEFFGGIRNQANAGLPVELDGGDFIDKAEEYRTEVMERLKAHTKVVILRG